MPPGAAHSATGALRAMRGRGPSMPLPAMAGSGVGHAAPWPPLLVLHGSRDTVVVPANGRETALRWAEAFGAQAQPPRREQRGARHPVNITEFSLARRTVVTLVEICGLGHAWSGGAAGQRYGDAQGPDASRRVWRFVAQQMRGRAPKTSLTAP